VFVSAIRTISGQSIPCTDLRESEEFPGFLLLRRFEHGNWVAFRLINRDAVLEIIIKDGDSEVQK